MRNVRYLHREKDRSRAQEVAVARLECRLDQYNQPAAPPPQGAAAALPLAAMLLLSALGATAQPTYSSLWGANGELWDGTGPLGGQLFDWSYAGKQSRRRPRHWLVANHAGAHPHVCPPAGYKQGNEPLPQPPVTRSVLEFYDDGMNDTAAIKAALDWANTQPLTDGVGARRCCAGVLGLHRWRNAGRWQPCPAHRRPATQFAASHS